MLEEIDCVAFYSAEQIVVLIYCPYGCCGTMFFSATTSWTSWSTSSLRELSPLPKASQRRSRKCKTETAQIITASPFKNQLENAKKKKQEKKKDTVVVSRKTTSNKSKKTSQRKKTKLSVPATSTDTTLFCICAVQYCDPPYDNWQQCPKCNGWYHVSCGPDDTAVCYSCLSGWTSERT